MFPSLEDVKVTNTRTTSTANPIGSYLQSSYSLSDIGNASMMASEN
jgi:hypothetical protein